MEIILQKALPHQQKAVDAVSGVFAGMTFLPPQQFYANPKVILGSSAQTENLRRVQDENKIDYAFRGMQTGSRYLPLDIKMETGTGKTYVYTHLIYELHQKFKINKFVIAVPSLAIKAGTAQFLTDGYVKKHFKDQCGYGAEIECEVLEPPKKKKKGRQYFPAAVEDFVKGSCQVDNRIYVLLVNMQLLTGSKNSLLQRDDYDAGVEGFYRPFDAIKATRPFVIIDEPHRFSRDQKAYQAIEKELDPQCIIRFGATFPLRTEGFGKSKHSVKDYRHLLYDLNACQSFNQGLIKGVVKEHFEPEHQKDAKVKIVKIESKKSVRMQYLEAGKAKKSFTLCVGDSLSTVNEAFSGITVQAIGSDVVVFSNESEKRTGEEMSVDVYMESYQEQMMKLAIERHFEVERRNFCDQPNKIKTLALFFIDDIVSYRGDGENEDKAYLRTTFEKLLKERVKLVLKELEPSETEYREFLEDSLKRIKECHAGYFAKDNDSSDEAIAKEVDEILHGKKKLLSFKDEDGKWNVRRFLFSKWTLKEGWDNPNVFTIAKLRSSGSEISKLQEVGRGLRLPVDENGNRVSDMEFQLNYIVDFSEADFAEKLVSQINAEAPLAVAITEQKMREVAVKLGKSPEELMSELLIKKFVDLKWNILPENREAFFEAYPDFVGGLNGGKIKDANKEKTRKIKIRKEPFDKIKKLWMEINQRYVLFYEEELNKQLPKVVAEIFARDVFKDVALTSSRVKIASDGAALSVVEETGVSYVIESPIPYGAFLRRISNVTNIPVDVVDKGLRLYAKKNGVPDAAKINERSAARFCDEFKLWKNKELQGRFCYKKSTDKVKTTALTNKDGSMRKTVTQGVIGTKILEGKPCKKYLYDAITYDSPLEKQNVLTDVDEIVVFGKIPRRSVAIPTIAGGTFSPDFMYVVKRKDGTRILNLIVETKDYDREDQIPADQMIKIECAKVFFANLEAEGYKVVFQPQLKKDKIAGIIADVLKD